jgi:exoribonuclease-2
MERYWCIRWLRQLADPTVDAKVLRDNLVKLEQVPLMFKVSSLPLQMPGSRVRLAIEDSDLIDVDVHARFIQTLSEPDPADAADSLMDS